MDRGDDGAIVFGRLGSRLRHPYDWWWDRRLGVRTFGYHPAQGREGDDRYYVHYTPARYVDLFRAFDAAQLTADDHYVDVGSGLGRTVFAAAHRGVGSALGVEYVEGLHRAALDNLANSRVDRARVALRCADATSCDLSAATVIFMFHPFGASTMRTVLDNLRRARADAGIAWGLRIIYLNPVCAPVLRESGWLYERAILPARSSRRGNYDIAIWSTQGEL